MAVLDDTAGTPRRPGIGRVGASLRPRISGFWRWWTQALAAWLPLRLRELFGLARERLLLQPVDDGLRLAIHGGAGLRTLGVLPPGAFPTAADGIADPLSDPLASVLAQRA